MQFNLLEAVEKIKNNKDFLKLKKIIENSAYHDHEPVYDHLTKTYNIACREIKGNFIKNKQAKLKFNEYLNQEIRGVKKHDLMLIFALIHDVGKIIIFDANGKSESINLTKPDGTTIAWGHEYWGSLIEPKILKELNLQKDIVNYLSDCVRLHGSFNNQWGAHQDLPASKLLPFIKIYSENLHVEQIFNGYVDCYTAPPFQPAIPIIHELLNNPKTYDPVNYSIVE